MFSCEYHQSFKNTFFSTEHLWWLNKIVQIFGCIIGRVVNRINFKMSFFHNKEKVVRKYIDPRSYNLYLLLFSIFCKVTMHQF